MISEIADGVIVGKGIVKIIEKYGNDAGDYLFDYVKKLKELLI
jgi:tryptophan synthase alpha chain